MAEIRDRALTVDMLLNTLEAERHVRRGLLQLVVDELERMDLGRCAADGRRLLERLDAGAGDAEFVRCIAELRAAVRAAAASDVSAPIAEL